MQNFFKHSALVGALALAATAPAHAEQIKARVTRIYTTPTNVVNVSLATGCKAGTYQYFQFTINSEATRAWYAMLLTAATNKTEVTVAFPGMCDSANSQAIQYIYQDF